MKIQVLIVDDEPLARERIRDLLLNEPDMEIVGECSDGQEAFRDIMSKQPDLIFLDIQMPGSNGFEVLEMLGDQPLPHIIFVTAYDEYALQAFEVHAVDYLLKPFDDERFYKALSHARQMIGLKQKSKTSQKIQEVLDAVKGKSVYLERLMVKSKDVIHLLSVEDIEWIEADVYYVKLHIGKEVHVMRKTMKDLQQRLDPEKFIRIHRSYMVNLKFIKEIQSWFKGDYMMILKDGTKLNISRTYQQKVFSLFNQ